MPALITYFYLKVRGIQKLSFFDELAYKVITDTWKSACVERMA